MKWYEVHDENDDVIVASGIILVREFQGYRFPWRLDKNETEKLTNEVLENFIDMDTGTGSRFDSYLLRDMSLMERKVLFKRHAINREAVQKPDGAGLLISKDEAVSIVVNSEDHIRIQVSAMADQLDELWKTADTIDDRINEKYIYAFDETAGYKTVYPADLGTGMCAYYVLHLPMLENLERFEKIKNDAAGNGVRIKTAFNEEKESNGGMYILCNEKTLGISEEDIIRLLEKTAYQLTDYERTLQKKAIQEHYAEIEDSCYRSYGILKYCRLMPLGKAMGMLSSLRWGQKNGLIKFQSYCNFHEMMLKIQQDNLIADDAVKTSEEIDRLRAEYIKNNMPVLIE